MIRFKPHLALTMHLDRESFHALKELLRRQSLFGTPMEDSSRITREALRRVYDQIRDVNYNEPTKLTGLNYE